MVVDAGPVAEVGFDGFFRPRGHDGVSFVFPRLGSWEDNVQVLPAFKVFVAIEEVVSSLAPGAVVYSAVFAWFWSVGKAEGAEERFGGVVFWVTGFSS